MKKDIKIDLYRDLWQLHLDGGTRENDIDGFWYLAGYIDRVDLEADLIEEIEHYATSYPNYVRGWRDAEGDYNLEEEGDW